MFFFDLTFDFITSSSPTPSTLPAAALLLCFNLLKPGGSFLPAVNLKMPLTKETQLREENSHQSNSNT